MPAFSQRVGALEVVVRCRPDLEAQARFVLNTLASPSVQLREGLEISFGWSALFAHRDGDIANRL